MTAHLDFDAVKAIRPSSVVGQSIELRRAGREWKARCPFHPDTRPSLTINDEKGIIKCFACGWSGDAADFVKDLEGCSLREAVERIGVGDLPKVELPPLSQQSSDTNEAAKRIWHEAGPIDGTPAERYLWNRGIRMKLPPTLRFSRLRHPSGGIHPCLVALVTSPQQTFSGIQRTFLTEDGRKAAVDPVKMSLGRIGGCSIRLAPAAAENLIITEGIEDGLTLQQELGNAVWVAAGASMLASMQFPPLVRSVVIAADNDAAGEREAQKAAECFVTRGLAVRIMRPRQDCKDFNQALMEAGE